MGIWAVIIGLTTTGKGLFMYNEDECHIQKASRAMNENKDCAVRAIAHGASTSYQTTHAIMSSFGRKRRGSSYNDQITNTMHALNMETNNITRPVKQRAKTVKTAQRILTKGTYLVFTRCHLLCIIDGEVRDWADDRQLRIQKVLEVTNTAALVKAEAKRELTVVKPSTVAPTPAPTKPATTTINKKPPAGVTMKLFVRGLLEIEHEQIDRSRDVEMLNIVRHQVLEELVGLGYSADSVRRIIYNWIKEVTYPTK